MIIYLIYVFIGCENGGVGEFCCTNGANNADCSIPSKVYLPIKEYLPPTEEYLPPVEEATAA